MEESIFLRRKTCDRLPTSSRQTWAQLRERLIVKGLVWVLFIMVVFVCVDNLKSLSPNPGRLSESWASIGGSSDCTPAKWANSLRCDPDCTLARSESS